MLGKLLCGSQIYNFVLTDLLKINHFGEKKDQDFVGEARGQRLEGGRRANLGVTKWSMVKVQAVETQACWG